MGGAQIIGETVAYHADLGECPVWDEVGRYLYHADVNGRTISRTDARLNETKTWPLPDRPGSFALRQHGGAIVALRTGAIFFDFETGHHEALPMPSIDFGIERFNDGACDRRGRFWVGTMDRKLTGHIGALYRIDPDHSVHRMVEGTCISNGLAWSPDDTLLYHCESRPGAVFVHDYDIDSGEPKRRRLFADFAGRSGVPDGCTVDSEGCLLVTVAGGGEIVRFAPDGREIGKITMPVRRPTSVAFGGDGFRTLYVTSMRYDMSPEDLARAPNAGAVFAVDAGLSGIAEPRFAG